MKYKFGNKTIWKAPRDIRGKGRFAFVKNPSNFFHCREQFMDEWFGKPKRRRILMSVGSGTKQQLRKRRIAVASFIWQIEEQLHIPDARKTLFNETDFDRVIRIKVAPFWTREKMRLSLFTLLLRAGVGCSGKQFRPNKDSVEDCAFSQSMLKPTKKALHAFLKGKTHYLQDSSTTGWNGWNSSFRDGQWNTTSLTRKQKK